MDGHSLVDPKMRQHTFVNNGGQGGSQQFPKWPDCIKITIRNDEAVDLIKTMLDLLMYWPDNITFGLVGELETEDVNVKLRNHITIKLAQVDRLIYHHECNIPEPNMAEQREYGEAIGRRDTLREILAKL